MSSYPVPDATPTCPHESSSLVRRSRFLASVAQVADAAQARDFVDLARKRHPDASHHCWAFVAGSPGSTARVGSSDDGEPHGTAGRPMLNVLLHSGVGDICAVVTRWFGGIKLGTGGLARAYQDAVLQNLASLPLCEKIDLARICLELPYARAESLRRMLPGLGARIENEEYGENVRLILALPRERCEEARALAQRLIRPRPGPE